MKNVEILAQDHVAWEQTVMLLITLQFALVQLVTLEIHLLIVTQNHHVRNLIPQFLKTYSLKIIIL